MLHGKHTKKEKAAMKMMARGKSKPRNKKKRMSSDGFVVA